MKWGHEVPNVAQGCTERHMKQGGLGWPHSRCRAGSEGLVNNHDLFVDVSRNTCLVSSTVC